MITNISNTQITSDAHNKFKDKHSHKRFSDHLIIKYVWSIFSEEIEIFKTGEVVKKRIGNGKIVVQNLKYIRNTLAIFQPKNDTSTVTQFSANCMRFSFVCCSFHAFFYSIFISNKCSCKFIHQSISGIWYSCLKKIQFFCIPLWCYSLVFLYLLTLLLLQCSAVDSTTRAQDTKYVHVTRKLTLIWGKDEKNWVIWIFGLHLKNSLKFK